MPQLADTAEHEPMKEVEQEGKPTYLHVVPAASDRHDGHRGHARRGEAAVEGRQRRLRRPRRLLVRRRQRQHQRHHRVICNEGSNPPLQSQHWCFVTLRLLSMMKASL